MARSGATAALIVAAGRGVRAGGDLPKQYQALGEETVLARSIRAFADHPTVDHVTVVIHPDDRALYETAAPAHPKLASPVLGADRRQASVRAGLATLSAAPPARVLIHDAVRPFVSAAVIDRVLAALDTHPAVLPGVAIADTLKQTGPDGLVTGTVPRDGLFAAQTPQGFAFDLIRAAHERAAALPADFTDDAAIAEWAGIPVRVVPSEAANRKLTTAEDMAAARAAAALMETRVGTGYDVHAFGPGTGVTLGGLWLAHDRGLVGHSDADVALHALTDAVLGTIAEGDIGAHFPPSDPAWRGASSDRFLADAVARLKRRGGVVVHLDLTILAEAPKIGPHRDAMRARIAAIAGIGVNRVAVKATTHEGLGAIGRGEGIAAFATATVHLPLDGG